MDRPECILVVRMAILKRRRGTLRRTPSTSCVWTHVRPSAKLTAAPRSSCLSSEGPDRGPLIFSRGDPHVKHYVRPRDIDVARGYSFAIPKFPDAQSTLAKLTKGFGLSRLRPLCNKQSVFDWKKHLDGRLKQNLNCFYSPLSSSPLLASSPTLSLRLSLETSSLSLLSSESLSTASSSSSVLFLGSHVILFSFFRRLRALANQVDTCVSVIFVIIASIIFSPFVG